MKKRFYKTMVTAAVFGSVTSSYAWEYKYCGSDPITDISVSLDGRLLEFDVLPQIINDRTMVPMRAIFEALTFSVEWIPETQTIEAWNNAYEEKITLRIGSSTMLVENGDGYSRDIILDSPAVIIDGRTLVPVRAISESAGCKVAWEPDIKYVHIASLHRDNYSPAFIKDEDVTWGDYSCEAICDNKGRRWISIYAEEIGPDDDMFIETENGEYLFFKNGDNLTAIETENGYRYSIEYIPFPDTYTLYCYPVKNGEVCDRRTVVNVDWNRN